MLEQAEHAADMPEAACVRVRKFSSLGRLQQAHTLTYSLAGQAEDWLLSVRLDADGVHRSSSARLQMPYRRALRLLDFLYENAVPLEEWQDVLADILPPGKWSILKSRVVNEKTEE